MCWVDNIKLREVLKEGFIPFSDENTSSWSYSAEMYCGFNNANYDNIERIEWEDLEYWNKIYCVAWNVGQEIVIDYIPLPIAYPVCWEEWRYAKITLDQSAGWLVTDDNKVWFGDKFVQYGQWFELPLDAQTSSHNEWAVITYNNGDNKLRIDLLKDNENKRQDFAWLIEFYWAAIDGAVIKW